MGGKWSKLSPEEIPVPEIQQLLDRDPYLKPYEKDIRRRWVRYTFDGCEFL